MLGRLVPIALLLIALVGVGRACVFRPATAFPGSHFNRATNAAWLDIDWVNEPKPTDAVGALGRELSRHQVRYAFVYVTYLTHHGQFDPTYAHAAPFPRALKTAAPEVAGAGLNRAAARDLGPVRPGPLANSGY